MKVKCEGEKVVNRERETEMVVDREGRQKGVGREGGREGRHREGGREG